MKQRIFRPRQQSTSNGNQPLDRFMVRFKAVHIYYTSHKHTQKKNSVKTRTKVSKDEVNNQNDFLVNILSGATKRATTRHTANNRKTEYLEQAYDINIELRYLNI